MALISIRNVVAPFENKTHLFTIIVVATIFGIWRASGGSVTSQPISSSADGVASRNTTEETRFQSQMGLSNGMVGNTSNTRPASQPIASQTTSSTRKNELDSLLTPQKQVNNPASTQKHHSALDDIEKSLGMR